MNGRHEHGPAYVVGSVFAKVPGDRAASHREADEGEVVQVERSHQLVEVFSEGVVVVAARRLAGVAEPSAVVRDDSVARTEEVRDLLLPRGAAERPSMNQHDGFPGPVILVVDLNRRRIFLTNGNAAHRTPPGSACRYGVYGTSPGELLRAPKIPMALDSVSFGDRGSSGQVGPQHPFLLLETAGDLDVDILRRKVLFAPVNTAANLRDRHARTVNERLQEETFPMFVKRERRKRRFLHRPLDRPVRRAVQLNRAFRHEIGEFSRLVREAVEQLMKLGESRALEVPMRLLGGRRQGRHIREVQIQPANEPFLDVPSYSRSFLTPS